MTEADLVAALRLGDETAWNRVHQLHGRDLYACAAHQLGQGPDAENAAQEAWLTAHLKIQGFEWRGNGSLYAWLRRICVFKAFEVVRVHHKMVLTEGEALEALAQSAARQAHLDSELEDKRQVLIQLIKTALAAMGEPCARLLDLRELQGHSYAAVSKVLRWPMGTVMSRLARCRRLLKESVRSLLGEGA